MPSADTGTAAVQVTLGQGDIVCTAEPTVLTTVLGSCVAVCLWDRVCGAGGMNHFVLPIGRQEENNTRYGDVAIDALVDGLLGLGSGIGDLQAKVFGGAEVLPFGGRESIGASNVRLALERLNHYQIPIAGQRTGGTLGQQIRFHTATGDVFVRWVSAARTDLPAPRPARRG